MSSTLGLGYVAITPINLDTVPSPREGSKAGLLTLFWSDVRAVNKTYVQPVNLLLSYQTGQFTTVQAILVDNSQTAYPVQVLSQSTGQRIIVPAYAQSMTPLLVSVAPQFTVSLLVPSGVTVPVDRTQTQFWFLNTPQIPYITTGLHTASVNTLLSSASVPFPSGAEYLLGVPQTVATLAPAFSPGGIFETYVSITIQATQLGSIQPVYPDNSYVQFQTSHGGRVTWVSPTGVIPYQRVSGTIIDTTTFTFPANVLNSTGDAILLQLVVTTQDQTSGFVTLPGTVSYSFYYSVTSP